MARPDAALPATARNGRQRATDVTLHEPARRSSAERCR